MKLRFFLAGIMQGSHLGQALHNQSYRHRLKALIEEFFPESEVYDPLADHSDSLDYDDRRGREVFERHNRMCAELDVVIAFVPQASMGTAIEMWEAWNNGTFVAAISPLTHNWVIRFCAHVVYPDVETFDAEVRSGRLAKAIEENRR